MYFRITHAACDGSESGCAEAQVGIEVTDFITGAQLREAVESVSDVATDVGGIQAVIRARIVLCEELQTGARRIRVGCEEPFAGRGYRTIEFAGNAVDVSEL